MIGQNNLPEDEGADKVSFFRKKIGGMTYHVGVHFPKDSRQNIEHKLKKVICFVVQSKHAADKNNLDN